MFRLSLALVAGFAWIVAIWLATHHSENPSVLGRWSPGYAAMVACAFAVAIAFTVAHIGPVYQVLHPARGGIALLAISTLLTAVAVEVFVRVSDLLGVSYYEESQRYFRDRIADDELVYRHRPNWDATYQGVRIATNEIGFRDRPLSARQPGELRILLLGDSVAFGWGVREEDTFARRIEGDLAKALGRPVRVVNSGVSGYNTEQEFATLKRYGPQVAPDLVMLVYVANDIEINEGPYNPAQHTSLEGKSPPEVMKILLGRLWTYRFVVFATEHRVASSAPPGRSSAGWKRSMKAIEGASAFCREAGIPLVVFLYEHVPTPTTAALNEDIGALSAKLGFPYTSTVKWLSGRPPREVTNSVVDAHPNALGHQLLEQGMLEFLLAHRGSLIDASGKLRHPQEK